MGGSYRKIGPDQAQVEYRLTAQSGCEAGVILTPEENDAQLEYRLASGERPLEWVGSGLAEFGIVAGTTLRSAADLDMARAIMDGRDPRDGSRLVQPKMAVHPDAKLPVRELVEAVRRVAEAAHMGSAQLLGTDTLAERFAQLERGLDREGDAHRAPAAQMVPIAEAAGIDPELLWPAADLEEALANADRRVRVGNRGGDMGLDLPKSFSLLGALGDEALNRLVEDIFMESVRETVAAAEQWVAYGMRGHHGNGQTAEVLKTSGLMGTITLHRTARPVDGEVGDPHLHAHVMLANMVRCSDGEWRTVAAGGRDFFRHIGALGSFVEARMRAKLRDRLGLVYMRDERTQAWELDPVGPEQRAPFSRRNAQILAAAGKDATSAQSRVVAAQLAEDKQALAPTDVRAQWRQRALDAGIDPDALVAAVLGGGSAATGTAGPDAPLSPDDVARIVFDPEHGVTAGQKVVRRSDVFRAVMQALPEGIADLDAAERLTDYVLASPFAVRLPDSGSAHMANAARYTSSDVLQAEQAIRAQARKRRFSGCAQIPVKHTRRLLDQAERDQGFAFSARQRQALERLLGAGHGIDALIGVAGAGKTTIMRAARQAWEAQGLRVGGAATAAVAAANLHAEAGIASRTIASLLEAVKHGQGLGDIDVLVIDEGAMVDDRALARLLTAAETQGVKVVGIGDPKQLRAVGIGGGFAEIHRIVDGLTLDENMRQKVRLDREALATWREGTNESRFTALAKWAGAGRIHAAETPVDTYVAALANWWRDASAHRKALDVIDHVLLLAGRNADVEELNLRARSLFRLEKRLHGRDVTFAVAGGERLSLARGEIVRVRANDYRSRRDTKRADVLNGYRAEVLQVNRRQGALIQWRRGRQTTQEWISPAQIAAGHLSHGYAMTVAAAQGLTADRAHIYGLGVDGHTLYSAMSRAKLRTDLYLPLAVLESLEEQAARGRARTERERTDRAVAAYAPTVNEPDDAMVTDETTRGRGHAGTAPVTASTDEPGPRCHALLERRRALAETVGALERVEEAATALAQARERVSELDARAQRGHVALALEGTSRAQVREQVTHARQVLAAATEQLEQARRSARERAQAAGLAADSQVIRSAYHELVRRWDRLWAQAERADASQTHHKAPVKTGRTVPRPSKATSATPQKPGVTGPSPTQRPRR
ncbi:MobF family relaxase [Marinactinospora thermotolerans]|uniref:MobF family relaxase n=1 Tax=Marinactinospora thermotolerans TaxID=531310 RepID=UPI003D8CB4CB